MTTPCYYNCISSLRDLLRDMVSKAFTQQVKTRPQETHPAMTVSQVITARTRPNPIVLFCQDLSTAFAMTCRNARININFYRCHYDTEYCHQWSQDIIQNPPCPALECGKPFVYCAPTPERFSTVAVPES
ncbi:hypothetical protein CLAIMM_10896, partial [Cladophialophora immunda]